MHECPSTTYTQEQCKLLARDLVLGILAVGNPLPSEKEALTWLRNTYPKYFNKADERAFLTAFKEVRDARMS